MRSPINARPLIRTSVGCIILGLIVAGLMRGWIIVQLPTRTSLITTTNAAQEKTCTLWFFGSSGWKTEEKKCVWSNDTAQALEQLVSTWLTVLEEEGITATPVKLSAALVSAEQTAYLSFDRSPFAREESLHEQSMWVEGLLKTIREAAPAIRQVMFLVNNQPLANRHFDFQNPWPIKGFFAGISS